MHKVFFALLITLIVVIACNFEIFKKDTYVKNKENIEENNSEGNNKSDVDLGSMSRYEKGLYYFNQSLYAIAKTEFVEIPKSDVNYPEAQKKIKECNVYIEKQRIENEKRQKNNESKTEILIKYKKLFEDNDISRMEKTYMLMENGFKQYDEEFEDSPDGSNRLATYYQKNDNGFTIHVRLQSSYSPYHHFSKVWIE